MKSLVLLSILFSLNAFADRKIGNVIAVEREISDVYTQCLNNMMTATSEPKALFSCAIKYARDGELPVSKGRILKLVDQSCSVTGDHANGSIIITFTGARNPSTFESARSCLQKSLAEKESLRVILYTLE
jgi:hypothetical protein